MPEQCVGISKDEQFHTCPRHSHIHAAYVGKEAYFALFVGAHKAYYYNVAFLSLKTVHGIYRHKVFERFEKGILAEHASQKLHLRFVGRDYAYVEVLFEHAVLSYFVYVVFKRVYGQFRFRRVYSSVCFANEIFVEVVSRCVYPGNRCVEVENAAVFHFGRAYYFAAVEHLA